MSGLDMQAQRIKTLESALKSIVKWIMCDEDGKILDDSDIYNDAFRRALRLTRKALDGGK